jgi:hypothetical protein
VTASEERPDHRDTSVAAYEVLRGGVLSGSTLGGPAGLVWLQREGITAWRSRGAVDSARVEHAKEPDPDVAPSVSDAIQVGVVRLLASMALCGPQEMRA